jgi:hypothetical protein
VNKKRGVPHRYIGKLRTDQLDFVVCARIRTVAQFGSANYLHFRATVRPEAEGLPPWVQLKSQLSVLRYSNYISLIMMLGDPLFSVVADAALGELWGADCFLIIDVVELGLP